MAAAAARVTAEAYCPQESHASSVLVVTSAVNQAPVDTVARGSTAGGIPPRAVSATGVRVYVPSLSLPCIPQGSSPKSAMLVSRD